MADQDASAPYDVFLDGEKIGKAAVQPSLAVGEPIEVTGLAGSHAAERFTVTEIHPDTQRVVVVVPSKDDAITRTS